MEAYNENQSQQTSYYNPFPRQALFHKSQAKYRLFGGAAGPGKTKALLWEAIKQALATPGVDTLLLRRTYPELESSLLAQFRRDVPKELYRSYNDQKHIVTWRNGSTTRFGHCLTKKDVITYQGGEYLFIGIDEVTHFDLYQWQYLTSRNRCPVKNTRPSMAGATNPGGIGHAWVKALWIDHTVPEGFDRPENYDPRQYEYIPSLLDDNPIYANDAEYRKTLEALPGQLREAFLHGNWDIYAGQYFNNWDDNKHVIEPNDLVIQDWWPRWGSFDWGYGHDAVFEWHVQCGTIEENGKRRPVVITYREFAKKGLSERALAEEIVARNNGDRLGNIWAGHDLWRENSGGQTKERAMNQVFTANGMPAMKHAKIDRVDGWRLCHRMLDEGEYLVTSDCPRLIAAIPQAIHDAPDNVEDVLKVDDAKDNDLDAWRYGLYTQFAPAKKPFNLVVKERTEHLNPTNRAMQITKILAERDKDLKNRGGYGPRSFGRAARYQR